MIISKPPMSLFCRAVKYRAAVSGRSYGSDTATPGDST